MPRLPKNYGEKFSDPIIGRAWHADGTPFNKTDYKQAGMYVPTDEDLLRWAKEDEARAAIARRTS